MKRINKILICILLVVVTLCALTSCNNRLYGLTLPELNDNEIAFVIKNGYRDYTIYTVDLTVFDNSEIRGSTVLEYLSDEEGLTFEWAISPSGFLLIAIGSLTADASEGEFIRIMTNNTKYHWAKIWGRKEYIYNVGDVQLKDSWATISQIRIEAGDVVYFELYKNTKKK